MVDCPPKVPADRDAAIAALNDNPCLALPQLRAALYQVMAGNSKQKVRFGEREVTYHAGNIGMLREEVRRLEIICGGCQPRAYQGTGANPCGPNYGYGSGYAPYAPGYFSRYR